MLGKMMFKFLKTRKLNRNSIFVKILSIYVPRLKTQRKIFLSHYIKFWGEFLSMITLLVVMIILFPKITLGLITFILSPIAFLWISIKFVEFFDIEHIEDFHITLVDNKA